MGIGTALLISLVGLALVFAVLIVLGLFVKAISAVISRIEKTSPSPSVKSVSPPSPSLPSSIPEGWEIAPTAEGEVKLYNVDDKTAAMLMAIVADDLGVPLAELKFLSIREVTNPSSDCGKDDLN